MKMGIEVMKLGENLGEEIVGYGKSGWNGEVGWWEMMMVINMVVGVLI